MLTCLTASSPSPLFCTWPRQRWAREGPWENNAVRGYYSERRGEVGSAHVVGHWFLQQSRWLVGIDQLGSAHLISEGWSSSNLTYFFSSSARLLMPCHIPVLLYPTTHPPQLPNLIISRELCLFSLLRNYLFIETRGLLLRLA